jgi:hypothetical protein
MLELVIGTVVGVVVSVPTVIALLGVCYWWSLRSRMLMEEALEYRMVAMKMAVTGGDCGSGGKVTIAENVFGFASGIPGELVENGDDSDEIEPENRRYRRRR